MLKALCVAALAAGLAGCGAPGDPMPPLLNIPSPTEDLEAVQRGGELILRWTLPSMTTEGFPLKDLDRFVVFAVELEGEPAGAPSFDTGARELDAIARPGVGERIERRLPLPAAPGRRIALMVENYNRRGRTVGRSNVVVLEIAAAPAAPESLRVTGQAEGILLEWPAVPGASGYQVYRGGGDQPGFALLAAVEAPRLTDTDFLWNTSYQYFVRAYVKTSTGIVEGAGSPTRAIVPQDTFPPSAPEGLKAVAGEAAVDLSWSLSPEPDTAGYNVYRRAASEPAGPAVRLNTGLLAAPTFSDREVRRGEQYLYTVSAVDDKGNESPPSAPAPANMP